MLVLANTRKEKDRWKKKRKEKDNKSKRKSEPPLGSGLLLFILDCLFLSVLSFLST